MKAIKKSIVVIFVCTIITGCPLEGDKGDPGTVDTNVIQSVVSSTPGLNCWDINFNGAQDIGEEDRNLDGLVDINDCHVDADRVRQNPDAEYRHEKICKAFHALGLAATDAGALAALGCHSLSAAPVLGTVQEMTAPIVVTNKFIINDKNDGSPGDNILFTNQITAPIGLIYKLKMNAYIAKNSTFDILATGNWGQCKTICENDNECIAAFAEWLEDRNLHHGATKSSAGVCHIFHRSDALDRAWEQTCGFTLTGEPVEEACASFAQNQMHLWIRATTIY